MSFRLDFKNIPAMRIIKKIFASFLTAKTVGERDSVPKSWKFLIQSFLSNCHVFTWFRSKETNKGKSYRKQIPYSEASSEPSQTSKMERFVKTVNGFQFYRFCIRLCYGQNIKNLKSLFKGFKTIFA